MSRVLPCRAHCVRSVPSCGAPACLLLRLSLPTWPVWNAQLGCAVRDLESVPFEDVCPAAAPLHSAKGKVQGEVRSEVRAARLVWRDMCAASLFALSVGPLSREARNKVIGRALQSLQSPPMAWRKLPAGRTSNVCATS